VAEHSTLQVPDPLDLSATMGPLRMKAAGRARMTASRGQWAGHTPAGPAVVDIRIKSTALEARATGPGAIWLLGRVPDLIGLADEPAGFSPPPGIVRELHRRTPGLRIGRTGLVLEALIPAVLGQRVTSKAAVRSYRTLAKRHGVTIPGTDIRLAPPAQLLADLPLWEYHAAGVEKQRAVIIIEAARRAKRLEEAIAMERTAAYRRLTALRGIGPWTAGHVMGIAWGDADAVPVGDYHLPNTVAWALAGEDRADDARMLELLEPYRGHRRRVVLLLKGAGVKAPQYGPRVAVQRFDDR
jgi:3-methyladenine DNA glycosylase/8-oxoguanine DNA glycosylase